MTFQKTLFATALCSFYLLQGFSQSKLPRSTPEREGVSSAAILAFINAEEKSKSSLHSFMLLRHGKVIAEGWWNPYSPALRHSLYSCSKSFTATAVGFAINEKLLTLDDKVISFFPELVPDTASANLKNLRVRDVLTMSDGQDPDPTYKIALDSNWAHAFLNTGIKYEPGTKFLYNSLGTYMLSAIVQKVAGIPIVEYLKPRLFDPLGITDADWETDMKGINTGGWGLRLKTEDMAKFAQLFLQKGKWNGKQILPAGWVEEASTMKILQDPDAPQAKKDSSDWLQGYGYQMWRSRHNSFRGDGAYGQYMIVMPEEDVALAITAETPDMQEEINLVWQYLLPGFHDRLLQANTNAYTKLSKKLRSLSLPPAGTSKVQQMPGIAGKKFNFKNNDAGINSMRFNFTGNNCMVEVETKSGNYPLLFSPGKWMYSSTNKPAPSLTGQAIERTAFLYPAKVTGSYRWKDPQTLELVLRYIETPHSETWICHFEGANLTVEYDRSLDFGKKTFTLKSAEGK